MKLIEKLRERENIIFPYGKIALLDGRELVCHPLEKAKQLDLNNIEFDTTGLYLTFGKQKRKKKIEDDAVLAKRVAMQNMFIDNAPPSLRKV